MKCWICGESANSGEHKAKASDVRSVFGTPTQDAPINLRTNIDGNQRLIGVNVSELKWSNGNPLPS